MEFRPIRFEDIEWVYDAIASVLYMAIAFIIIILPYIGGMLLILWFIIQWIGIFPSVIIGLILLIVIYKGYKVIPMED